MTDHDALLLDLARAFAQAAVEELLRDDLEQRPEPEAQPKLPAGGTP